jgi:cytidine deaminase
MPLNKSQWNQLGDLAWSARENAHLYGSTAVGAAVISEDGRMFSGCNVEHRFRSHDVHAEVNAITTMASVTKSRLLAIVIVAERERFTPCGACLDWIFEFGGPECQIGYVSSRTGTIQLHDAAELMPFYPR